MPKGQYEEVPRIPPEQYIEMGDGLFRKSNLFSGKNLADGMGLIPSTLWMRFFKAGLSAEDALGVADQFDAWVQILMGWSAKLRRLAFELQTGKLEPRKGPYSGPRTSRKHRPRVIGGDVASVPTSDAAEQEAPEQHEPPTSRDVPDSAELAPAPLAIALTNGDRPERVSRFSFSGLFR